MRALQVRLIPHFTCIHIQILAYVIGSRPLQACGTRGRIQPFKIKEDDLAPVAEKGLP